MEGLDEEEAEVADDEVPPRAARAQGGGPQRPRAAIEVRQCSARFTIEVITVPVQALLERKQFRGITQRYIATRDVVKVSRTLPSRRRARPARSEVTDERGILFGGKRPRQLNGRPNKHRIRSRSFGSAGRKKDHLPPRLPKAQAEPPAKKTRTKEEEKEHLRNWYQKK